MECVEGKAVHDLAPLDWQRTCAIMLDLCLPLALLHARRFVHCDLTARNVLTTQQGVTKLIDFGALAPMDQPPASIAGTPPHMPPELVNRGSLDGRVDIFGLGALGYWLLSGRHAYPAETIRQLPLVWEIAPQTLTELGVVLPRALDELIMSMLSLDVAARPRQIAEVLQRLCALTGTTRSIERSAIGAQLSTSKLVGRDRVLGVFRELLGGASQQHSSVLCLQGAKGSGRSRLIDALALEAALAESIVLRMAADQEREVEFGVLARLMQSVVRLTPAVVSVLPAALATACLGETEQGLIEALAQHDPQRALSDLFAALCHIDAQFLVLRDVGYELRSDPIRQRIRAWLDPQEARAWNARLGELYERRGHARRFLSALHYWSAEDLPKAYALVLPVDAQLLGPNDPNIPVGGSARGIQMHEALLEYAIAIGAPQPEVFHLRRVLVMIGATSNPALGVYGEPLLAQLRFDTGLDLWESMDPELSEHARLLACLKQASERYLLLPEQTRGLPVPDAIRQLAACGAAVGTIQAAQLDVLGLRATTKLVARLRTLAPALRIAIDSLEATTLRVAHGVRAPGEWRKLVAELAVRPEGMDEQLWQFRLGFLHYRLGMDLADAGERECLSSVALLMNQKRLVAHAHSVRLLFALARGDYHEAQRMRRERAIAVLASGHEDQQLALGSMFELELLDVCGDLLELQRMAAWYEARAKRFAGWAPLATIARVYYLMNCDESMRAIELLDEALPLAPPLEHAAWYELRALRAEATWNIGDSATAIALAESVI